MTNAKHFTYQEWDCHLALARHKNGGRAIMLVAADTPRNRAQEVSEGEPIARVTVNVGDLPNPGEVAVRAYAESEQMLTFMPPGLLKPTGRQVTLEWVVLPICVFDEMAARPYVFSGAGS